MKILSLDGGGIRGIFSAQILLRLQQELPQPLHSYFDLIAGTSTGSIIAGALITNQSMAKVIEGYRLYGKRIFTRSHLGAFQTIYNPAALKELLHKVIGSIKLGELEQPLLIPTVNYKHGSIHIFRSGFSPLGHRDAQIRLSEAILTSCSAPVYFPPQRIKHEYLAGDGGLWANNPSMVCLTEALEAFQLRLEEINILSLGTGKQKISIEEQEDKLQHWGFLKWMEFKLPFTLKPKLLDLALHVSSESITYQCQILCRQNYFRVNGELHEEVPFDQWSKVDQLTALADHVYDEKREEMIRFVQG